MGAVPGQFAASLIIRAACHASRFNESLDDEPSVSRSLRVVGTLEAAANTDSDEVRNK